MAFSLQYKLETKEVDGIIYRVRQELTLKIKC
jgi:hypothetical protein